jgi:transcriptional regulator with XRE-family HTH domain
MNSAKLKIGEIRKLKGISQEELATLLRERGLRVNQQRISEWETATYIPRFNTLVEIASVFKVKVDDLIGE